MVFSSTVFLFLFFPISVIVFHLCKKINGTLSKLSLVIMSLGFFGWTNTSFVKFIVVYSFFVYVFGIVVYVFSMNSELEGKTIGRLRKKSMALFLTGVIGLLVYFKYYNFIIDIVNSLFSLTMDQFTLIIPLGISYLTFSSISYLVDIYRKDETPRNILDTFLYLTFFPKVASGPITLYKDFFKLEISKMTSEVFVSGLNRFIIGLAKKVMIADYFGQIIADMGSFEHMDQGTAILSVFIYGFQLYFDFAGYSDMAIGLGRMVGFDTKENFNFPYRSLSITEFWRRWHISLGRVFKEYLYIPLGGNRISYGRTLVNLAVVFFLTGLWHGAGFTYILWGCGHGFFMILERIVKDKGWYGRMPRFLKWLGTMTIVFIGWELFRYASLEEFFQLLMTGLGQGKEEDLLYTCMYWLDIKTIFTLMVAGLGSTVLGIVRVQKKILLPYEKSKWVYAVAELSLLILFALSVMQMINTSYSPFIYFQY